MIITKKITGAIAAIALVTMVTVVTFAFKADKVKRVQEKQWYSIANTTNTSPSSQTITATISAPDVSNPLDCAQTLNSGNFCAVLLEFPEDVEPPMLSSGSVQDALDTYDATIVTSNPGGGYARRPL